MSDERLQAGLKSALARIVSGAFLLTLRDAENQDRAILLTFVQQVGFEPPKIVFAVRKGRPIVESLDRDRGFVLNIAPAEDDQLIKRFGRPGNDPRTLFEGLDIERRAEGVVLQSAAAHLVGAIEERVDVGDHWLYVGRVWGGGAVESQRPYVHVRKNGLSY